MDVSIFHSLWTVLLLIIFIGIVGWVFVLKRRSDFEIPARIPLDDEPEVVRRDGQENQSRG